MPETTPATPEITVLVTAHNEADQIQPCLQTVLAQDYPMERVEIVLVDDRSTDGTAALAEKMKIPALRVVRIDQPPPPGQTARQVAIDAGMRAARGEVVLVTDAGGRLPREWIRELSGHIGYRDGALGGPVAYAGANRLLASLQSLDALMLVSLYRWANRHNRGTGLLSANMAVRPEAYGETGGLPELGFAPGEGETLAEALLAKGWTLRYLNQPAVQAKGTESVGEFFARLRRVAWGHTTRVNLLLRLWCLISYLLLLLALAWGGFWMLVLLVRWGLGVLWIAFAVHRYPVYVSPLYLLIYEPLMLVLYPLAWLTNLLRPEWQWGGVSYRGGATPPPPPTATAPPAGQ